jgi:hypothetical protein
MHTRGGFLLAAAMALLAVSWSAPACAFDPVADMAGLYSASVDRKLAVPAAEAARYARVADEALFNAEIELRAPQYLLVVDRDPNVQALFVFFRDGLGRSHLVGASPVSTGRVGGFDSFETPTGVFDHGLAYPDFRSAGKPDVEGLLGYGVKGMRIFDFGWQEVPKGWGDGSTTQVRLQMHATDPALLERRLGTAQSKGCIRIPATLVRLIDRFGLIDADYLRQQDDRALEALDAQRAPVAYPGRYLVVVDTRRHERPDWSPRPYIPHRKPPAPKRSLRAPAPRPR